MQKKLMAILLVSALGSTGDAFSMMTTVALSKKLHKSVPADKTTEYKKQVCVVDPKLLLGGNKYKIAPALYGSLLKPVGYMVDKGQDSKNNDKVSAMQLQNPTKQFIEQNKALINYFMCNTLINQGLNLAAGSAGFRGYYGAISDVALNGAMQAGFLGNLADYIEYGVNPKTNAIEAFMKPGINPSSLITIGFACYKWGTGAGFAANHVYGNEIKEFRKVLLKNIQDNGVIDWSLPNTASDTATMLNKAGEIICYFN